MREQALAKAAKMRAHTAKDHARSEASKRSVHLEFLRRGASELEVSEEDLEAERAAIEQMGDEPDADDVELSSERAAELEHAWRTLVGEFGPEAAAAAAETAADQPVASSQDLDLMD